MAKESKFRLEVTQPYSTFIEGHPAPIPYVIDGLLPDAAFSVLGGKPKHGKSSMSRVEAVCVAKGMPFLDRDVTRGEVLLCSLEDPRQHVDNCLKVLDYNPATDALIHIVSKVAPTIEQTIDGLATHLAQRREIKLVLLDTLAKVIRAKDSNNYDEMLTLCEQLHLLARETKVHIQALAHCKKVQPEDPFDGLLGSVELRAEADTNVVLYDSHGKRMIQSETRMGTHWEPREIHAELASVGKAQMVMRFFLGDSLQKTQEISAEINEKNTRNAIKSRIVDALKANGCEAKLDILNSVQGRRETKLEIRDEMIREGIIKICGVPRSKANPQTLVLLKPDWTSGTVVTDSGPTAPSNEPTRDWFCTNYRVGCQNRVFRKGDLCESCSRVEPAETPEGICAN